MRHSAADCGLAPMMLRRHFTRRWGVTPHAYRHRFSHLAG
jgi:transcriptional regulator GlxA family with amidase domain